MATTAIVIFRMNMRGGSIYIVPTVSGESELKLWLDQTEEQGVNNTEEEKRCRVQADLKRDDDPMSMKKIKC